MVLIRRVHAFLRAGGYIVLGLFATFLAIYTNSIDVHAANIDWYNFIFDADVGRVISDAEHGQNPVVYERHPLFVVTVGSAVSVLAPILGDKRFAVQLLVAVIGAIGVAASYLVFYRIGREHLAAVLFATLYGLAAAIWLLSSLPETFAINATIIAICFLIQRKAYGRPIAEPVRFALIVLFSAIASGITVANVVYVGLAYVSIARRAQPTLTKRAVSIAGFAISVALTFGLLSWLQATLFPDKIEYEADHSEPLAVVTRDPFLDFDRELFSTDALREARFFLVDNLIAPRAEVAVVETLEGPVQMIQFGDWSAPLYLAALGLLGTFGLVTLFRTDFGAVLRAHTAQLALAYVAYNLVFHFFYRANGQPLIFSIHTVLPLLALLAHAYSAVGSRRWGPIGALAVLAVAANNATLIAFVNRALALPCEQKLAHVCIKWEGDPVDERFSRGLAAYMSSAPYWLELGNEAMRATRPQQARGHYQRALALDAELSAAQRNLGIALCQLGRLSECIAYLVRYLEAHPEDQATRQLLAQAQRQKRAAAGRERPQKPNP